MTVFSNWRMEKPEKGKCIRILLIWIEKTRDESRWEVLRQQSKTVAVGMCKGRESGKKLLQRGQVGFGEM